MQGIANTLSGFWARRWGRSQAEELFLVGLGSRYFMMVLLHPGKTRKRELMECAALSALLTALTSMPNRVRVAFIEGRCYGSLQEQAERATGSVADR